MMRRSDTLMARAQTIITNGPLIFGNLNQIWAVEILSMLAEVRELYAVLPEKHEKCRSCAGKGYQTCGECGHESDCGECGGRGKVLAGISPDEFVEIAHLIKHLNALRAEREKMAA